VTDAEIAKIVKMPRPLPGVQARRLVLGLAADDPLLNCRQLENVLAGRARYDTTWMTGRVKGYPAYQAAVAEASDILDELEQDHVIVRLEIPSRLGTADYWMTAEAAGKLAVEITGKLAGIAALAVRL
jgi:hypothetical protein